MSRRLMIGLLAVSMVAVLVLESYAADIGTSRRRGNIITNAFCTEDNPSEPPCEGVTFTDLITGVDGCQVTGTLICEPVTTPENGMMALLNTSEELPALVLAIDKDSIGVGTPPNHFSRVDINWWGKGLAEREQLRRFKNHVGDQIVLYTGNLGDAGLFSFTEIPATWSKNDSLSDSEALHRFVGNWNECLDELIVDIGFGLGLLPQKYLRDVPGLTPLDAQGLVRLLNRNVCGVVHNSEIQGSDLRGLYLGVVAFRVDSVTDIPGSSSSTLPQIKITVLDADQVCAGPLTYDTALVQDAEVPFSTGESLTYEGEFTADECVDGRCEEEFRSAIPDPDGQAACDALYGVGNTKFKDLIIDEFLAVTKWFLPGEAMPFKIETKKCTEPGPGEVDYECMPYDLEVPNCLLGPKVDMVFALDLTGSMGEEIDNLKSEIGNIINRLTTDYSFTNFRFGVVSYEDYPYYFDCRVEGCGSTYYGFYGDTVKPDAPWRIEQALTENAAAIITFVQGATSLQLGFGGDGPQSYGRVFWEVSQPDTGSELGWRAEARKLLVNFGDNVPHDTNLKEGIESPPSLGPSDTGVDPGRDNLVCNGVDIDFQNDALAAMINAGIKLLHIDSSGLDCGGGEQSCLEPYWGYWTSLTGGAYAAINADGTIPGEIDLTDLIVELLELTEIPAYRAR